MNKDFFYNKMTNLLKNEADDFFKALGQELNKGIRLNGLKLDKELFLKLMPFNMIDIPWCKEGFFLTDSDERPSKHPYYYAGLYYLQEPSAMLPVEALDIKPGDKVLDISAAPGGKSTQIASKLQNKGIIVANDINPKRAIALQKNISMFGIKNNVIFNQKPDNLVNVFEGYFDKILVDAPCSGEGLIKKDFKNYESDNEKYVAMQKEILKSTQAMLKSGGEMVYSTCTFSPEENEGIIKWFIEEYAEFEVIDINITFDEKIGVLSYGQPDWVNGPEYLSKVRRAWPHKIKGEGHFIAKLRKNESTNKSSNSNTNFRVNNVQIDAFKEFSEEYNLEGYRFEFIHNINNQLYYVPENLIDIKNLKAVNIGLNLGEIKNKKFIPSQELALVLNKNKFVNNINLSCDDIRTVKYLKGETIETDSLNGWNLLCCDGFGLGWVKSDNGIIKNFYKKQWRML